MILQSQKIGCVEDPFSQTRSHMYVATLSHMQVDMYNMGIQNL